MKRRILAFALALAAVFAVSMALWAPGEAAQESAAPAADEWVGYFLAREEAGSFRQYEGKYWAEETTDGGYDFGIPGSACFLSITEITPDDAWYEPGSPFNCSADSTLGEGISSSGIHVYLDDEGTRYEIEAAMTFADAWEAPVFTALNVYRTGSGEYYAEAAEVNWAFSGSSSGLAGTHSANIGGKTRTIHVSLAPEQHAAAERAAFLWLDGEKNVIARAEYETGALPGTVTAPEGAALLVLCREEVHRAAQNEYAVQTARSVYGPQDSSAEIYAPGGSEGLAERVTVLLEWKR